MTDDVFFFSFRCVAWLATLGYLFVVCALFVYDKENEQSNTADKNSKPPEKHNEFFVEYCTFWLVVCNILRVDEMDLASMFFCQWPPDAILLN